MKRYLKDVGPTTVHQSEVSAAPVRTNRDESLWAVPLGHILNGDPKKRLYTLIEQCPGCGRSVRLEVDIKLYQTIAECPSCFSIWRPLRPAK